jgi:hypothetical protein
MRLAILFLTLAIASPAFASDLILKLPENKSPKSASANSTQSKPGIEGKLDQKSTTIKFEKLDPETPYDIAVTLTDGTTLQGVNLAWYGLEAPKADAAPLDDDDRKAIADLIKNPKAFENKQNILYMTGDNTRATALVELIRDKDFHASGGNIIWRVELWYFENQFGGWAKVVQQNKVLRRERFKDQAAFDAATSKIKWIPQLGGIKLPKDKPTTEITLPAEALAPPAQTNPPKAK